MERRSLVVVALALAFALAGCDRPQPDDSPGAVPAETPVQATADPAVADPAMERRAECVNPVEGYAVEYPAAWHVNTGEILGPCALFDPEPIRIPRDSELPLEIAIRIDFEPVAYSVLTGDVLGRRIVTRERTEVDGREAMRIEGVSTGEGLHDRGIRSYEYLVDLGDTTMIAATYDAGALPFERKRRILDAMMRTFDFRQPG